MTFLLFIFLILFPYSILISQFRSVKKLDASPSEKCLVLDENGIAYVKKCKKGKYCNFFSKTNEGICSNFILPLFVGDACGSNEECLSQNCDKGKCEEPEFCFNDLQCDSGKFCDIHNKNELTYKCLDLKKENDECLSNEECGKFMLCNSNQNNQNNQNGKCTKIASLNSENNAIVMINGSPDNNNELNKFLCESGVIYNDNNKCVDTNSIEEEFLCDEKKKCQFNNNEFDCLHNPIDNNFYCPVGGLQKKVFKIYKDEIDTQFEKYENDDLMWNWNNNKLHADKKDLKEKFFYGENYFFGKYNTEFGGGDEDDKDAINVIEFLQQMSLSANWIMVKKYFFILCVLLF
jgi:hypothetical protein